MNLPNKLTLTRIILVPFFLAAYMLNPYGDYWIYIATGVFALAALTDMLDGRIARKRNLVTDLGKLLDPIADKLLISSALFIVLGYGLLPSFLGAWAIPAAIIITVFCIGRDFAVSALRQIAASKKIVIAADIWGKLKMVFQVAALFILLPAKPIDTLISKAVDANKPYVEFVENIKSFEVFTIIGFVLLAAAALLSLVSGINYIVKNRKVFSEKTDETRGTRDNI